MKARKKVVLGFVVILGLIWLIGIILINVSKSKINNYIEQDLTYFISQISSFVRNEVDIRVSSFVIGAQESDLQKFVQDANRKLSKRNNPKEYIERTNSWWVNLPDGQDNKLVNDLVDVNMSEKLLSNNLCFDDLGVAIYLGSILTDSLGGLILASAPKPARYDYTQQEWWNKTKLDGLYFKDSFYDETSKKYVMRIGVSIKDDQGNFIGAQRININLQHLLKALVNSFTKNSWYSRYNTNYTIIDTTGKVFYSTYGYGFLDKYNHLEIIKSKLNADKKIVELEDNNGKEKTLFFNLIRSNEDNENNENYTWIIVTEYDKSLISSDVNFLANYVLFFFIVITILLSIAFVFVVKLLIPVWSLHDEIQKVKQSDLADKVDLSIADDFNNIGKILNELFKKIANYQEQVLLQKREMAQVFNNFKEGIKEKTKNRELFLKEQEKLIITLKSIQEAVIMVDNDGIITMMNNSAENLMKVTFKNDVKMHINSVFFIQENKSRSFKDILEFLSSPENNNYLSEDVTLMSSNGVLCSIHNSISAIVNSQNSIIGVIFVFRDIK